MTHSKRRNVFKKIYWSFLYKTLWHFISICSSLSLSFQRTRSCNSKRFRHELIKSYDTCSGKLDYWYLHVYLHFLLQKPHSGQKWHKGLRHACFHLLSQSRNFTPKQKQRISDLHQSHAFTCQNYKGQAKIVVYKPQHMLFIKKAFDSKTDRSLSLCQLQKCWQRALHSAARRDRGYETAPNHITRQVAWLGVRCDKV